MEAILIDSVNRSLRHVMNRNAIFICERLCAEFSSEMDLLTEAEAALCPVNEPGAEIPNGAAGHYLLGLIYRTRQEFFDDSRSYTSATTSVSTSTSTSGDAKSIEQDAATTSIGGIITSTSKIINSATEVLNLLKTLGEGYRLSCLYRCQDALDVYMKLPHKHYNTVWVLSQVGKAHFELVDYLGADRAFSSARQASPYSLEGMDIYSAVLYCMVPLLKKRLECLTVLETTGPLRVPASI